MIRKRTAPLIITPHAGNGPNYWEDVEYVNATGLRLQEILRQITASLWSEGSEHYCCRSGWSPLVNPTGNAGLAKGGSGDVLTGMILAFLGRYKAVQPAVSSAVYMHGYAQIV